MVRNDWAKKKIRRDGWRTEISWITAIRKHIRNRKFEFLAEEWI